MKPVILTILSLCLCSAGFNQEYAAVDNGSSIKFTIKNFGVNVGGSLSGLQGRIHFNEADIASASFDVSLNANSVNTGINGRDNHLRKEEYFDVQKYPKISFVSKKINASGTPGTYYVTGIITIKGISREINFPFTVLSQNDGLLFTGSFKLNRRDFNVGGSSLILSDNLLISLNVSAKKHLP